MNRVKKSFIAAHVWIILVATIVSSYSQSYSDTSERAMFAEKLSRVNEYNRTLTADTTEGINYHNRKLDSSVTLVGLILRIIGYLIVITVVIIGLIWFLKKAGIATVSRSSSSIMDIVEILPLAQKTNIVVVRVMDKVYVVGQTTTSIILLDTIEGQKALEIISSSKGGISLSGFRETFNSFISKMKKQT